MKVSFCLIAILLLGCISETYAADQLPSQTEFYPPSGKGRVIVVISGQLGPGEVAYYAKDIAAEGYYAVLVDGRDFWKKGYWSSGTGWALLRGVVARAQQSPHALTALSSEIRRPGAAMMRPTRSGGLWTIYNELPLEPPLNGRG